MAAPRKLRNGLYDEEPGIYWAWPVDDYWDVHHAPVGIDPDGSDVVSELHGTLAEARREARELHESNMSVQLKRWEA